MEIRNILDENEEVYWSGKPNLLGLILNGKNIGAIIFGVVWLTFLIPFLGVGFGMLGLFGGLLGNINFDISSGAPLGGAFAIGWLVFLIPFLLIGFATLLAPLWSILAYRNMEYLLTSKRVILSGGIIGKDFTSIDYDQIKNIDVKVGLFKNFGNIEIFSGEMGRSNDSVYQKEDIMYAVGNPYEVFKKLKQYSHDIKTDIEYPNALRPEENPGYDTEYKKE
jgi:hypothetical protein